MISFQRKIISNIKYFSYQLPALVVNFLGGLYLFSLLSPADFGKVAIILGTLEVFSILGAFRFDQLYFNRNEKDKGKEIGNYVFLNILTSIVSIAASIVFYYFFKQDGDFSYIDGGLILFFALEKIVLSLTVIYFIEASKKWEKHKLELISSITSLLALIVAVFMAKNGYGLWSLLGRSFVKSFCFFVFLSVYYPLPVRFKILKKDLLWYYHHGKRLFISNIVSGYSGKVDDMLMGYGISETILGYYDRAFQIARFPSQIVNSFISLNYPLLLENRHCLDQFKKIIHGMIVVITFLVTIILSNGLFFIKILSIHFLRGNWDLIIRFSAGLFLFSLGKGFIDLVYNALVAREQYDRLKRSFLFYGLSLIAANIVFFVFWKAWGIVAAQGLGMFFSGVFILLKNHYSIKLLFSPWVSIIFFGTFFYYIDVYVGNYFSYCDFLFVLLFNALYIIFMLYLNRKLCRFLWDKLKKDKA